MKEYILKLKEDVDSSFLEEFGGITYKSKFSTLVFLKINNDDALAALKSDDRIEMITENDIFGKLTSGSIDEDIEYYGNMVLAYSDEEEMEIERQMAEDLVGVPWEVDAMQDMLSESSIVIDGTTFYYTVGDVEITDNLIEKLKIYCNGQEKHYCMYTDESVGLVVY